MRTGRSERAAGALRDVSARAARNVGHRRCGGQVCVRQGLFTHRTLLKGDVITEYDGPRAAAAAMQQRTHLLRIRGSDVVIDGAPISRCLTYDPQSQLYWPHSVADFDRGYGALADSSRGHGRANAVLLWTLARHWPAVGRLYRVRAMALPGPGRIPAAALPRGPCAIPKGGEIKLKYQVQLLSLIHI